MLASWHHTVPHTHRRRSVPPQPLCADKGLETQKFGDLSATSNGQSWTGNRVPPTPKPWLAQGQRVTLRSSAKTTGTRCLQIQQEVLQTPRSQMFPPPSMATCISGLEVISPHPPHPAPSELAFVHNQTGGSVEPTGRNLELLS